MIRKILAYVLQIFASIAISISSLILWSILINLIFFNIAANYNSFVVISAIILIGISIAMLCALAAFIKKFFYILYDQSFGYLLSILFYFATLFFVFAVLL